MEEERTEEGKKLRDARKILFRAMQESADFINYDVEVILKERPTQDKPNDFFRRYLLESIAFRFCEILKNIINHFALKEKCGKIMI